MLQHYIIVLGMFANDSLLLKNSLLTDEFVIYDNSVKSLSASMSAETSIKLQPKNNERTIKIIQAFSFITVLCYQIWPKYFFNAHLGIDM